MKKNNETIKMWKYFQGTSRGKQDREQWVWCTAHTMCRYNIYIYMSIKIEICMFVGAK